MASSSAYKMECSASTAEATPVFDVPQRMMKCGELCATENRFFASAASRRIEASGFVSARRVRSSRSSVRSFSLGGASCLRVVVSNPAAPEMAAATSWPVDDNPRSLQNCLQPAPQMMKAACLGWFWPSAMNRSHLPWIVAVDGRWSSQNADGHTAHRNSNPPACAAFRPQVSQEWCGQPHEPNFFVGSAKPIFCKQPACHDAGHWSQQIKSPPSQQWRQCSSLS